MFNIITIVLFYKFLRKYDWSAKAYTKVTVFIALILRVVGSDYASVRSQIVINSAIALHKSVDHVINAIERLKVNFT